MAPIYGSCFSMPATMGMTINGRATAIFSTGSSLGDVVAPATLGYFILRVGSQVRKKEIGKKERKIMRTKDVNERLKCAKDV